jgi:hypothetical protein
VRHLVANHGVAIAKQHIRVLSGIRDAKSSSTCTGMGHLAEQNVRDLVANHGVAKAPGPYPQRVVEYLSAWPH